MIYFDSAATTMQKPPEVLRATKRAFESFGGAGRGGHRAAMLSAEALYDCREAACTLFHAPSPERVVLTQNATHALNLAIKGLAAPGKTVLVSGFEHNAVMRPLYTMRGWGISTEVVDTPLFDPQRAAQAFEDALGPHVGLVACTHVSNVFGTVLPVEALAQSCARRGIPLVVDASQSAGILPLDMRKLPGVVLCMPGHKGLYGPQGTGLLLLPEQCELPSLMEGGTGSNSLQYYMPEDLPDALEAGTQNAWGAAGLCEGIRFVMRKTPAAIDMQERALLRLLTAMLSPFKRLTLYSGEKHQTGVLSFTVEGMDAEDVASELAEADVAVRAGLQCAPLAHQTAGTLPYGTVRVSFSAFSTEAEVRAFVRKLQGVVGA